jgi:hypothetical protein
MGSESCESGEKMRRDVGELMRYRAIEQEA